MIYINDDKLLDKILEATIKSEYDKITETVASLIAEYLNLNTKEVEWCNLDKEDPRYYYIGSPGQFYARGEPIKLVWCTGFCEF